MLDGAAGSLGGNGSTSPVARTVAHRYISLFVTHLASIAVATTAQFRISIVNVLAGYHLSNLANATHVCEVDYRHGPEQQRRQLSAMSSHHLLDNGFMSLGFACSGSESRTIVMSVVVLSLVLQQTSGSVDGISPFHQHFFAED